VDPGAFESIDLYPNYVNRRRIAALVGAEHLVARAARPPHAGPTAETWFVAELTMFKDALLEWLRKNGAIVEGIDKLIASGEVSHGKHFWAFRDFYGRGLRARDGEAELHAAYEFDEKVKLRLVLDRSHVAPGSPSARLTGHQGNLFVFGTVEAASAAEIVARPAFIGDLCERGATLPAFVPTYWLTHGEVQPDAIDNFDSIRNEQVPRVNDLKQLWRIPEVAFKQSLCEIIGEPEVQKDWGGERSDVFTTHVRLDGREVAAAFLLKGPGGVAAPAKMTFRQLGKNGDQIDRLFSEPADILFLQYCAGVMPAVRNTMRAYAMERQKKFCVIDGYSTIRLLRAYSKCGFTPKPMKPRSVRMDPAGYSDEPEEH
jgi:hypothetical protein